MPHTLNNFHHRIWLFKELNTYWLCMHGHCGQLAWVHMDAPGTQQQTSANALPELSVQQKHNNTIAVGK